MTETSIEICRVATKIIQSQIAILGPQIAIAKAREITGLTVTDSGAVSGIKGKPKEVLQSLVSKYTALSGEVVKNIIKPIVSCYPEIYFDDI